MSKDARAINHGFHGNYHVAICLDNDGYFHAIQELASDHKTWQPWSFSKKRSRTEKSAIGEACRDVIKRAEWSIRLHNEAKRICSEMAKTVTKEVDSLRKVRRERPDDVENVVDAALFWGLCNDFDVHP
jgi:sugar-specific transcriptional regulator TrmB